MRYACEYPAMCTLPAPDYQNATWIRELNPQLFSGSHCTVLIKTSSDLLSETFPDFYISAEPIIVDALSQFAKPADVKYNTQ